MVKKLETQFFENNNNRLKPIGLPFIPKKLSKNEYYTALKGFAMVSDGETLTKEVSIHEDFELLNLEDQFSMIQINSQKDFDIFYKNNLEKFNSFKIQKRKKYFKNVI